MHNSLNDPGSRRERDVTWRSGWRKLQRLWRSDTAMNVDEELRFHFEQKVAEFVDAGLSEREARTRAEEEFGDLASVRESLQTIDARVALKQRRAEWWEAVAQDLRYVVRSLRRSPVFTVTVVVTLALGLGANAAIFSVLDQLYFRSPAAVPDAQELRRVYHRKINFEKLTTFARFDYPQLVALRAASPEGLVLAGYSEEKEVPLGGGLDAAKVGVNYVDGDYFGVLRLQPQLGRFFSADESSMLSLNMVAVISDALWQREYGRDREILGRTIELGSHKHQIIGVAPAGYRGLDLDVVDVWVPQSTQGTLLNRPANWLEQRYGSMNTRVISRPPSAGAASLFEARATAELRKGRYKSDSSSTTFLGSVVEAREGQVSQVAITTRLAGVAAVILLIACANVVNLMLARAASRRREIAVRLALGVSRKRLFMQLIAESSVLALFSGAVALFVAYVGTNLLRNLLLPNVAWGQAAVDGRVIAFTAIVALCTGFLAGLLPALQASKPDLTTSLKSSARDGGSRHGRIRNSLLVVQAAMSVVLLTGAGVFVQSMRGVEAVDIGYDFDRLLFASVTSDRELGDRRAEIASRLPEMAEKLKGVAGIEQVALTQIIPFYGFGVDALHLPDRDSLPPTGKSSRFKSVVSANFFATVGMRAEQGRLFTSDDRVGSEPVMVMNRDMANNLWPGENPLEKCLIVGDRTNPCRRVVGIVSHAHFDGVIEDRPMQYYVPLEQIPNGRAGAIAIRASAGTSPAVLGNIVRRRLASEYGAWAQPVIRVMRDLVEPDLRPWRVGAALFTSAGLLALLVAAVGIYSSVAYTLSQRTREIGVRIALGADSATIMRQVVGEGARVIAVGISCGILLALALGSLVASLLYNTSPRDPWVMAAAATTILLATVLACAIPAWRASRVDPLHALRTE